MQDFTATVKCKTTRVEAKVAHAASHNKSRQYETKARSALEVDVSDLLRDAFIECAVDGVEVDHRQINVRAK